MTSRRSIATESSVCETNRTHRLAALMVAAALIGLAAGATTDRNRRRTARTAGVPVTARAPSQADHAEEIAALLADLYALGLRRVDVCDRTCAAAPARESARAISARGASAMIVDGEAVAAAGLVHALRARGDRALVVLTTAADPIAFVTALAPQTPDWVAVSTRNGAALASEPRGFRLVVLASNGALLPSP